MLLIQSELQVLKKFLSKWTSPNPWIAKNLHVVQSSKERPGPLDWNHRTFMNVLLWRDIDSGQCPSLKYKNIYGKHTPVAQSIKLLRVEISITHQLVQWLSLDEKLALSGDLYTSPGPVTLLGRVEICIFGVRCETGMVILSLKWCCCDVAGWWLPPLGLHRCEGRAPCLRDAPSLRTVPLSALRAPSLTQPQWVCLLHPEIIPNIPTSSNIPTSPHLDQDSQTPRSPERRVPPVAREERRGYSRSRLLSPERAEAMIRRHTVRLMQEQSSSPLDTAAETHSSGPCRASLNLKRCSQCPSKGTPNAPPPNPILLRPVGSRGALEEKQNYLPKPPAEQKKKRVFSQVFSASANQGEPLPPWMCYI